MYGHLIMMAHKIQGVHFVGVPEYIDFLLIWMLLVDCLLEKE